MACPPRAPKRPRPGMQATAPLSTVSFSRGLSGAATGEGEALAHCPRDPFAVEPAIDEELLRIAVLDQMVRQAQRQDWNRDAARGECFGHRAARPARGHALLAGD